MKKLSYLILSFTIVLMSSTPSKAGSIKGVTLRNDDPCKPVQRLIEKDVAVTANQLIEIENDAHLKGVSCMNEIRYASEYILVHQNNKRLATIWDKAVAEVDEIYAFLDSPRTVEDIEEYEEWAQIRREKDYRAIQEYYERQRIEFSW